jgi:fermentation-respiration switch protein FrsA (DUF1100 family)
MRTFYVYLAILCLLGTMNCRFVVNRFAFFPDRQDVLPVEALPAGVEEVFLDTPDGERIQCYWMFNSSQRRVLIYFHGNAGNIGHRLPDLRRLHAMGLSVLGAGYRGYGKSSGRPSERGLYHDGKVALDHVIGSLGFNEEDVVLLGRSIGSTVAVENARKRSLAATILVTPMTSGKAVAKAHGYGPLSLAAGNAFDNYGKIEDIRSPLLIIHGTRDEVIPFSMGQRLFEKAHEPKRFAPISGAGHNDIGQRPGDPYWIAIEGFLKELS